MGPLGPLSFPGEVNLTGFVALLGGVPSLVWEFLALALAAVIGVIAAEFYNLARPSLHFVRFRYIIAVSKGETIRIPQNLCHATHASDFLDDLSPNSPAATVIEDLFKCERLLAGLSAAIDTARDLLREIPLIGLNRLDQLEVVKRLAGSGILKGDIAGSLARGELTLPAVKLTPIPLFPYYDSILPAKGEELVVGYTIDLGAFFSRVTMRQITPGGSERTKVLPFILALQHFDTSWLSSALRTSLQNLSNNLTVAAQVRDSIRAVMEDQTRLMIEVLIENKGTYVAFIDSSADLRVFSGPDSFVMGVQVVSDPDSQERGPQTDIHVPGRSVQQQRFVSEPGALGMLAHVTSSADSRYELKLKMERRRVNGRRVLRARGRFVSNREDPNEFLSRASKSWPK